MILLWFVIGMILAFGIARYNESNKLFWQLAIAFIAGYAITVMCTRTFNSDKRNNENLTQVYPTQEQFVSTGNSLYLSLIDNNIASTSVTGSNPVSQEYTPDLCEMNIVSSKVFGRTRDQPQLNNVFINKYIRNEKFLNTS